MSALQIAQGAWPSRARLIHQNERKQSERDQSDRNGDSDGESAFLHDTGSSCFKNLVEEVRLMFRAPGPALFMPSGAVEREYQ